MSQPSLRARWTVKHEVPGSKGRGTTLQCGFDSDQRQAAPSISDSVAHRLNDGLPGTPDPSP